MFLTFFYNHWSLSIQFYIILCIIDYSLLHVHVTVHVRIKSLFASYFILGFARLSVQIRLITNSIWYFPEKIEYIFILVVYHNNFVCSSWFRTSLSIPRQLSSISQNKGSFEYLLMLWYLHWISWLYVNKWNYFILNFNKKTPAYPYYRKFSTRTREYWRNIPWHFDIIKFIFSTRIDRMEILS